ncbi:MAG: DUF3341 domain-containing protein [Methylacidiphilales bacterium]|nr:DUF3341 domain-containing protein [Candidatus Methylacidiphilales bacterium]MDW8349685.1 DUF3341 domain-containing protein [Verrucomicrobiae bacterium]
MSTQLASPQQTTTPQPTLTWGIGAEFDSPASLLHAAKAIHNAGYKWWDVYTPFPIHGMDKAMGLNWSKVSVFAFIGGATGLTTGLLLTILTSIPRPQWLAHIPSGWLLDLFYPLVVQGKPYLALPAFFPVLFELTILLTAFGTIAGVLITNRLPRLYNPVFNWDYFAKATDDGFFLIIEAADPRYDRQKTAELLASLGGKNITLIPR